MTTRLIHSVRAPLKDLGPDAVSVVGGGTLKVESALGEVVIPLVGEPNRLLRLLEEYRTAPAAPPQ